MEIKDDIAWLYDYLRIENDPFRRRQIIKALHNAILLEKLQTIYSKTKQLINECEGLEFAESIDIGKPLTERFFREKYRYLSKVKKLQRVDALLRQSENLMREYKDNNENIVITHNFNREKK